MINFLLLMGFGIKESILPIKINDDIKILGGNLELPIQGISEQALVKILLQNQDNLSNIRTIRAIGPKFTDNDIAALEPLLKHLKNLKIIELSETSMTDIGAKKIARNLHHFKKLTAMNVFANQLLTPNGLRHILVNLPKSLHVLGIYYQKVGNISSIIKGLSQKNQLKNLTLSDTSITDFKNFFSKLPHMPSLSRIEIREGAINDDAMKALVKSAVNLPKLSVLNLENMQIGDSGALILASFLNKLTSFKKLYVPSNDIGDEGAQKLLPYMHDKYALSGNPRITEKIKDLINREQLTQKRN